MDFAVSVNVGPLVAFVEHAAGAAAQGMGNPDLREGYEYAQREYLAAMRERFDREGDGSWAPLAKVTQDEREYLGFPPAHPILKRLWLLRDGLVPGAPGNLFDHTADSFLAGYGGDFVHPGYRTRKGGTVGGNIRLADLADIHQNGRGRVPARPILVPPGPDTLDAMGRHITAGVRAMLDRAVAAALAA